MSETDSTTLAQYLTFTLGEETYASPAISGGQIFLRGLQHLYCIRDNTTRK